jgi:alpha-D-ribose 1-methylphosphonate 5-triphosphate synthase subunit PhnI
VDFQSELGLLRKLRAEFEAAKGYDATLAEAAE